MPAVMSRFARIAILAFIAPAALLRPASLSAQNTYTDLEGRFAIDLPPGWQLQNQQGDVWLFAKAGAPMLIVSFMRGESAREAAFNKAMAVMLQANSYPMPPADSLRDVEINGNPARQAMFPATITVGANTVPMLVFVGSTVIEGGEGAISYAAFMGEQMKGSASDVVKAFHSIRMPGSAVAGARNLRVASVTMADTSTSAFRHALMQVRVPAGWKVQPGSGAILGTLVHDAFGRISLMAMPKNELGNSAASILAGLQQGLQGTLGSMAPSGQPYTITTDGGLTVDAADFTGVITAAGTNINQGVTIAGFKDAARGVGFMAFYLASASADAKAEVMKVIKSLK